MKTSNLNTENNPIVEICVSRRVTRSIVFSSLSKSKIIRSDSERNAYFNSASAAFVPMFFVM